jgi:hypothetical protein
VPSQARATILRHRRRGIQSKPSCCGTAAIC